VQAFQIQIILIHDKLKKTSFDEFVVANETATGVEVKKHNGSGDISATLSSMGLIQHKTSIEKMESGMQVNFYPWRIDW
jgi:molybdopterin molybdotransferase